MLEEISRKKAEEQQARIDRSSGVARKDL